MDIQFVIEELEKIKSRLIFEDVSPEEDSIAMIDALRAELDWQEQTKNNGNF